VRFSFDHADDAAHGTVQGSSPYRFAWEQIEDRGRALVVEQLQFAPDTVLEARIEPADEFALALLWLAGDLVSSGFFRFGRFTTRGYGVVRLRPAAYTWESLDDLLSGDGPSLRSVAEGQSGRATAQEMLGQDPLDVVTATVADWLASPEAAERQS
jgi:hypothetical protein